MMMTPLITLVVSSRQRSASDSEPVSVYLARLPLFKGEAFLIGLNVLAVAPGCIAAPDLRL